MRIAVFFGARRPSRRSARDCKELPQCRLSAADDQKRQIILAFAACRRARKAAALGGEHAVLKTYAFAIEGSLVAFTVGGTFIPFQYTEMFWHVIGLSIALNTAAKQALASVPVESISPAWTGTPQTAKVVA